MIRIKRRLLLVGGMALITFFAACGDSSKTGTSSSAFSSEVGILRFVPADTPYLIATPGDLPQDVIDILEPQLDAVLQAYHQLMLSFVDNQSSKVTDEDIEVEPGAENIEAFMPIMEELGSLMSVEGLRAAGIDRETDVALYGTGLLPVLRMSLTDEALLEAALSRLEEKADSEMSVATIDGHSYRYVGDEQGRLIIAVIDNHLILTATPTELSDEQLKKVLGITLPAQNIAASGALQQMAEKYGFVDYMIGFMDMERIVATFIDEPSGINGELLALMDHDTAELSDVCKTEIRSIAGIMPRALMGYTALSTEEMATKAVLELRSDIAMGVASIAGAVPGLGNDQGGLMSFGFSMDLLAAREFYAARLDALEAEPYQCELFADMQGSVAQGRELLNQPVPPIVYGFKGVLAVIENLEGMDMQNNQPPTSIDMRMLVATDNAEGLLAMGSMFSPELASLEIKPDGQPVKLDIAQVVATTGEDVYMAMSENGLAVSVGEGMEQKLSSMLSAATLDPSPFSSFEVDAARYYNFVGAAMSAPSAGENPTPPEVREAMQSILGVLEKTFERIYLDVNFTEQGVEVSSKVTLAD
jgi:hypothetical protein